MANPIPEGFQDEIRTRVSIYLSFMDKLRILFGCNLTLEVNTLCENVPGRLSTYSLVSVRRNRKRNLCQPELGGFEMSSDGRLIT